MMVLCSATADRYETETETRNGLTYGQTIAAANLAEAERALEAATALEAAAIALPWYHAAAVALEAADAWVSHCAHVVADAMTETGNR